MTACRVLAGAGAGLVVAAGNAIIASANNPDRLYSILMIVTGVAHTILLSAGPFFTTNWSYSGAYSMEALFMVLLLPLIWKIPAYYVPKATAQSEHAEDETPFPLVKTAMVCLAMTIFFARDGALWGFTQEIGKRTGMGDEQIGAVLGLAGILGLSGALLVAFINVRFGRALPVTLA